MLVDLPNDFEYPHESLGALLAAMISEGEIPETTRLAKGVYEAHLNWNHEIEHLVKNEYPFDEHPGSNISDEEFRKWIEEYHTRPRDYGVCDSWEQILEKWPQIETDPRHFLIHLTPMRREEQSSRGGWRWHKWGEYIGIHEPKHEYLYDEKDIDVVYVFSILQLKSDEA